MTHGKVSRLASHQCTHEAPSVAAVEVSTASLSLGDQLFIWSVRRWRQAVARQEPLDDALAYTYGVARCPDAIPLIDELMSLVSVAAFRPFAIRCVPCQTLSADEWTLLRAVQAVQGGEAERATLLVGGIVAGRLGHTFCRAAQPYAEALAEVGVFLAGANLKVVE